MPETGRGSIALQPVLEWKGSLTTDFIIHNSDMPRLDKIFETVKVLLECYAGCRSQNHKCILPFLSGLTTARTLAARHPDQERVLFENNAGDTLRIGRV